jgi:hypothetical protein
MYIWVSERFESLGSEKGTLQLDTKMDGLKGEIMEVLKIFVTEKTLETEKCIP